ncbi:septum formation inhibitor Maf [Betaproteobacteria bacterium SCGC AG-212-J23]|nr:septum formation inhibitor Maf [Betaproteobacteria bacterium SCGC AG-212-J23]
MATQRRLVLASTSRYRRALLERLGLPFEVASPQCDETPLSGEAPRDTASRLATLKAKSLVYPDALVIGSDQVAFSLGQRLDKPGDHATATRQLRALSGNAADFHTAVALLDTSNGQLQQSVVPCRVTFRKLDDRTIETYLQREKPYDCAGSAKAEGLGIALIARIETEDPTSLIGLPLIALSEMLAKAGMPAV